MGAKVTVQVTIREDASQTILMGRSDFEIDGVGTRPDEGALAAAAGKAYDAAIPPTEEVKAPAEDLEPAAGEVEA